MNQFTRIAFTFLVALFISTSLLAQLQKGDRLLTLSDGQLASSIIEQAAVSEVIGTLVTSTEADGVAITIMPSYGFVLSEKVLVGGSLGVFSFLGDGFSNTNILVSPYARYYFLNKPELMVYGQAQAGLLTGDDFFGSRTSAQAAVGLSIPVTNAVLFSPELGYQVQEGSNVLALSLQTEFILGRHNRPEDKGIASFGKGSWMFGTSLGGFSIINRGANTYSLSPEVHYFLSNNFALGAGAAFVTTNFQGLAASNTLLSLKGRFYLESGKHFTPYIQLGGLFFNNGFTGDFGFPVSSESSFGLDGGIGGNLFIRDNLALEVGIAGRSFPEFDSGLIIGINFGARFVL